MSTKDELKAYCDEHGLEYHGNAGEQALQKIVDDHKAGGGETSEVEKPAEPEQPEKSGGAIKAVKNPTRAKQRVGAALVLPGQTYELTDRDRKDERLMKRVRYAIKLGTLAEA